MKLTRKIIQLIFISLTLNLFFEAKAQSYIKVYGQKVNQLDKQKRKQGDWIFFNNQGLVQMTCVFKDDICVSPFIFYENSDTSFVRLPIVDSIETFILFEHHKQYVGQFIHTSDSTTTIEIETDTTLNDSLLVKIKKYKDLIIEPNYYFAQKKLNDYLSASFSSSTIVFNKLLKVLIHISSSGNVTKVEFPENKTYLSTNEESELNWIYTSMPRWQPLFYKNKTMPSKIIITNNTTLSFLTFDR